ncbi:hypothetical protein BA6E_125182 [Bacteroidales bacterium 6E]|nr:hypothetical protein BA6E_125182 [Bacteroidales bacterium 6E]
MLKGILAIAGQPGLYRLVAEARSRIIVESLINGKKLPVSASAKISSLEDIAIYTIENDVPLKDVLKSIHDHENGGTALDPKSTPAELKKYFRTVLPTYDEGRVYISDLKKVLTWYNILQENSLLDFTQEDPDNNEKEDNPDSE